MTNARNISLCIAVALILLTSAWPADTLRSLTPPQQPVPSTLFGMHIHRADTTSVWPTMPFGSWRLWDTYAQWPWLEPQKGKWDFARLDKLVAMAQQHDVSILLPLALSPAWASARPQEASGYRPGAAAEPKNMDDWRDYIHQVATRYKGKIHAYEIWNEPNLKQFWSGNTDQLVALTRVAYETLKQVDSSNIVVSPAATGEPGVKWLDDFLAKGGGKYVDVIGYHLYVTPQPPEAMIHRIDQIHEVMAKNSIDKKPLWNTETGWLIANRKTEVKSEGGSFSKVLSEDEAAEYIARSYLLAWSEAVSRFYWYAWDNERTGLTEKDGQTVKSSLAKAYGQTERWMVGATFTRCSEFAGSTWVCSLSRASGYKAQIVWNPDKNFSFPITAASGFRYEEDIAGHTTDLKGKSSVPAGPAPILVENERLQ